MAGKDFCYHKECYKEVTNKTKIERSKQRSEKDRANLSDQTDGQETTMEQQIEKPPDEQNVRNLGSQGVIFKKDRCIFCQEKVGVIHKVAYMATGSKILDVTEKLQDMPLLLRLNNIPNASDAFANDVQYHRKCWVASQRKANVEELLPQELENVHRIFADIEIQNIVKNMLKESTESVTDMKSLNTKYNNLLGTNEVNYKRYLKQRLLENVPGVQFVRPPTRNQSERVCSSRSQSSTVEKNFRSSYDDYQSIFQAARKIKKEIKAQGKWQFEESFDGFSIPKSL